MNRTLPIALVLTHLAILHPAGGEGLPVAELKRDTPVDFAREIVPFLRKNCFACHNEKKAKADLNLESPKAMMAGGDSGPALVAGKPMESLIFTYAAHLEDDVMPPAKNKSNAIPLNPDELALLKLWIEQGGEGTSASVLAGPTEWQSLDNVNAIYAVAVSHDGRFAACGRGNRLYVYDLRTGELAAELIDRESKLGTAHRDLVHALSFNRHGLLASGGFRTVKLWQAQPNPPGKIAHALPEGATALIGSTDGKWLAAGDGKGNVVVQETGTTQKAPAAKVHNAAIRALLLSPDGKTLFSASDDKTVVRATFPAPKDSPKITLPSEGRALALVAGGNSLAVGCADGIVRIYPLTAFDPVPEGQTPPPPVECKGTAGKALTVHALNDEGSQLVSTGEDGIARVWDLAGKELRQIKHGGPIVGAAFHRANGMLATAGGDGVVRLWNSADGKQIHELKGDLDFEIRKAAATRTRDLAKKVADLRKKQLAEREKKWNELKEKSKVEAGKVAAAKKDLDAKETAAREKRAAADLIDREVAALEAAKDPGLAAAQGRQKKATDEANKAQNELVTAERGYTNAMRSRDLSVQDGAKAGARFLATQAASAQADGLLATAEETVKAREAEAAAAGAGALKGLVFSPDGKTIAVAAEKTGLRLWSATTAKPLDVVPGAGTPLALTYLGDGRLLAAFADKSIAGWKSPRTWNRIRQIGDGQKGDPFPDRVLALAFHPRGHLLATGSGVPSRNGELRFWRVRDGSPEGVIEKAHLDTITGLAFDPEGARIVSASTDRYLKIHDVETGDLLDQLEGHTNHVLDVAWSADGETLASAGADHVAKLWAVETSKQKKTEAGFKKELTAISFIGTSENFVTGGGDKVLKAAGQNLPGIDDFVYDVAVTPDGATIVSGGENGILRVWQASDRKLLHSFAPAKKPQAETAAK